LKQFAERIGIPAAKKLRKDEIEKAIVGSLRKTGAKDVDRGLHLKCGDLIQRYIALKRMQEFERVPRRP
jgi:hypothetical protein